MLITRLKSGLVWILSLGLLEIYNKIIISKQCKRAKKNCLIKIIPLWTKAGEEKAEENLPFGTIENEEKAKFNLNEIG